MRSHATVFCRRCSRASTRSTHTPAVAIWTHAALVLAFASTNTFQSLAIIGECRAADSVSPGVRAPPLELTRRDVRIDGPPFAPAGAWIGPVAGGVLLLLILSTATAAELAVTAVVCSPVCRPVVLCPAGEPPSPAPRAVDN